MTLGREQSIAHTQCQTLHPVQAPGEELFELAPLNSVNAALAGDPEVAEVILDQIEELVFWQPVSRAHRLESSARIPGQSSLADDPYRSGIVPEHRHAVTSGQSILLGIHLDQALVHPDQSVCQRTQPDRAVTVFDQAEREHLRQFSANFIATIGRFGARVVRRPIPLRRRPQPLRVEPGKPPLAGDP